MAMNPIQFQPGLSLPDFLVRYGSEAKCRQALWRSRHWRTVRSCNDTSCDNV